MSQSSGSLEQIFETHIQTLALTLRRDTVTNYRCVARRFLCYLRAAFPKVRRPAQLRRDPHLLGWFRWMCEQDPPLGNKTRADYLLGLRRLLDDLAAKRPRHPGGSHPPRGFPTAASLSAQAASSPGRSTALQRVAPYR